MRSSELLEKGKIISVICYPVEAGQLEGGDYVKVPCGIHWRLNFFLIYTPAEGWASSYECENVTAIPIFNLSEQTNKMVEGGEDLFCFTYEKYYRPVCPLL